MMGKKEKRDRLQRKGKAIVFIVVALFISFSISAGTLINVDGTLQITKNGEVLINKTDDAVTNSVIKYSDGSIWQGSQDELNKKLGTKLGELPGVASVFTDDGPTARVDETETQDLSDAQQNFFDNNENEILGYVYIDENTEAQSSLNISGVGSFEYDDRPLVLNQSNFYDDSGQIFTGLQAPVAPVVYPPMLEEVGGIDEWTTVSEDSNVDPWADFVFSDEATGFDDGIYYPTLMINGEYSTEIEVSITDNQPSISRKDLMVVLKGLVTDDFYSYFIENENDYYSEQYINSRGVGFDYNEIDFSINLTFTAEQIPIRNISIGSSKINISRSTYQVEDSVPLSPANFSFASNISLYSILNYDNKFNFIDTNTGISISSSNIMGFADIGIDFNFQLDFSPLISFKPTNLALSNFLMYYDFVDENVRFNFGNVFSGDNLYSGNPFGFALEKNYSYGSGQQSVNQYNQQIVLEQDSMVEIFINGSEVVNRNLKVGTYRLQDFAFTEGANTVKIKITSLVDASNVKEKTYKMGYDSSLLPKAESLWRFSFTVGHSKIATGDFTASDNGLIIPWYNPLDTESYSHFFDFSGYTLFFEQNVGISNSMAIIHYISASSAINESTSNRNYKFVLSNTITKAFLFGTSNINNQFTVDTSQLDQTIPDSPYGYNLGIKQSFNNELLKPLSLQMSYDYSQSRITGSAAYSLKIWESRLAFSGNVSYTNSNSLTWGGNVSLGFNFLQGLAASASFSISSTTITQDIPFRISVGLSMVLNKNATLSASATQDITSNNISLSLRPNGSTKHSIQLSLSGLDLANIKDNSLNGTWSYNGDLINSTLRQSASSSYTNFNTTYNLSTALVFADGRFGMTRNVSNDFFIIHPEGALKNSSVSVGVSANSETQPHNKIFGNVVYTNLTPYEYNSIVVFGDADSLFGSGGTFIFSFKPRASQAFVTDIDIIPTVTVSARLLHSDGTPYVQYSSPIYKITIDNDGIHEMDMSAGYYLFTDDNGRFIVSDLEPGLYCFDLSVGKNWYAICFDVPKLEKNSIVVECEDYQVSDEIPTLNREGLEPFKDYEETIYLKQTAVLNEADFWDSLFELEDANNLNSTSSGFGEDDDWMSWGDTSGDNWVVAGKEYNSGQTTTDEVLETGNTLDSSDNNMTNLDNETDIVAINSDEEEQNSNFIAN